MTTVSHAQFRESTNFWGERCWFSPDASDPEPHTGFCETCGAPAPLLRVYDGLHRRQCWDSAACAQRIAEIDAADVERDLAARFRVTPDGETAIRGAA